MAVLIWGIVAVGLALLIHFLVWQFYLPRNQSKGILGIFCLALGATFLVASRSSDFPLVWGDYFYISLMQSTIALAYLITYSGIEADSPTFKILLALYAKQPVGMTRGELDQLITDKEFILIRLDALVRDGLLREEGGRFICTPKAQGFLKIFMIPRRLLGIAHRGG